MDDRYTFIVGRRLPSGAFLKHWERVKFDDYSFDKPIVLVLGGDGTREERLANGNAKIVESLLGVFKNDIDLMSVNYNAVPGKDEYLNENCINLVNNLFMPCVQSNNERIDIIKACKNIRKITIMAHCFGDFKVLNRITKIFEYKLNDLGYNANEIDKIIEQLFVVGYGSQNIANNKRFKSIYCTSLSDDVMVIESLALKSDFLNNIDEIKMSESDKNSFLPITKLNKAKKSNHHGLAYISREVENIFKRKRRVYQLNYDKNINLITYGLYQSCGYIWEADHPMSGLARNINWVANKMASSTGDCVSKCLACALCNSVANSMLNIKSNELIEFDMKLLKEQIDSICQQHNYKMSKYDGMDIEEKFEDVYNNIF